MNRTNASAHPFFACWFEVAGATPSGSCGPFFSVFTLVLSPAGIGEVVAAVNLRQKPSELPIPWFSEGNVCVPVSAVVVARRFLVPPSEGLEVSGTLRMLSEGNVVVSGTTVIPSVREVMVSASFGVLSGGATVAT